MKNDSFYVIIYRAGLQGKGKMTPRIWGVTTWYQSLGIRLPRELGHGVHRHGLDTSFIAGY